MAENHTSKDQMEVTKEDQSTQNEYIIVINKKIRALKKKCQNIAYIEKKVAAKEEINSDQKKLLETKEQNLKSLREFEQIRNQFVEIYEAEQKSAPKDSSQSSNNAEQKQDDNVVALITLLHTSHVFDRTRGDGVDARNSLFAEIAGKLDTSIKSDSDLDSMYYLISQFFTNNFNGSIALAQKYATDSEEEFLPNVTFKQIRKVVDELAASNVFAKHPGGHNKIEEHAQQVESQHEQVNANPQQPPAEEHPVETKQDTHETQENAEQTVDHTDATAKYQESEENAEENNEEGFQTTEGRRGRGVRGGRRGRGNGRGGRGDRDRERPRGGKGGRGNFDNGNKDNRGPREGKNFESRSPRGGREFNENRGSNRGRGKA